jgi:hypothetical protein
MVVLVPPLPLLLLSLVVVVVAVVLRLLVGSRLLLSVLACARPHVGVLVLLVQLQRVLVLMPQHVKVLVGDRRLMFQLEDNALLLVGPLVLSMVALLVLGQLLA